LLSWAVFVFVRLTFYYEGELKFSDWLVICGAPIAVYLILSATAAILRAVLRKVSKSEGRYLISVNILWTFLVIAWAYIDNWGYSFDFGFYLAVIVLPLIGVWLGFFLWKWSKAN
jgi:hypothetical protein